MYVFSSSITTKCRFEFDLDSVEKVNGAY